MIGDCCGIIPIFDTEWTLQTKISHLTEIHPGTWYQIAVAILPNCTNPVDGAHFGRPWYQRHGSGRVYHVSRYGSQPKLSWCPAFASGRYSSSLKGPSLQALTLLLGARFITWRQRRPFLRGCRRSPKHFGECRAYLGYSPAPGPTLKKPCATLTRLMGCAKATLSTLYYLFSCNI